MLCTTSSSAQLELRSNRSLAEALSDQPEPLPLSRPFRFRQHNQSRQVPCDLGAGIRSLSLSTRLFLHQTAANASEEIEVEYALPAGLNKTDKFFGEIVAYYEPVSVELQLTTVPGPDAALMIEYQGCADWGFATLHRKPAIRWSPDPGQINGEIGNLVSKTREIPPIFCQNAQSLSIGVRVSRPTQSDTELSRH